MEIKDKTFYALLLALVVIATAPYWGSKVFGPAAFGGGVTTPAAVISATGTTCTNTNPKATINVKALESVQNNDGTWAQAPGTFYVYLKDSVTSWDAITANVGYGGSTSSHEVTCYPASQYSVRFRNASYYDESSGLQTATDTMPLVDMYVDKISSVTVTGENKTTRGVSSPIDVAMGSGETNTEVYLTVKASSARGVLRGPLMFGFAYDTGNFSEASTPIGTKAVTGCSAWGSVSAGGDTLAYQECYTVDDSALKNYGEKSFPMKMVAQTGVDPASEVVVRIADYGTYVKNGAVLNGYINPDTHQDVGAVDTTYEIDVS
jgi:hypothetical protein